MVEVVLSHVVSRKSSTQTYAVFLVCRLVNFVRYVSAKDRKRAETGGRASLLTGSWDAMRFLDHPDLTITPQAVQLYKFLFAFWSSVCFSHVSLHVHTTGAHAHDVMFTLCGVSHIYIYVCERLCSHGTPIAARSFSLRHSISLVRPLAYNYTWTALYVLPRRRRRCCYLMGESDCYRAYAFT